MRSIFVGLVLFSGIAAAQDYDLVIRGGRIVDGTGRAAYAGDVALRDGKIAAVGVVPGKGREEIAAGGRVVAPGFIDVHTHADDIADLPVAENFLRMGVTTLIAGNCGSSTTDVGFWFSNLQRVGVAVNMATLIGQGSVRAQVMGGSFMRPATDDERAKMRALVDRGMAEGAVGLSTGLIYLPGTFTPTAELVELAKVVAGHGGIYASHMRYENARITEALDEVLTVARGAGIRAQVSHIKLSSPAAWGRAAEIAAYLAKARADGIDIAQDQYAYTASSTNISALVDEKVREGGTAAFVKRMADPAVKAATVEEMKTSLRNGRRPDYAYAVIANFRPNPTLNGKTVPEAARLVRGSDTLDDQIALVLDLVAQGGAQAVFHGMNEDDLRAFMVLPLTMIASDSGVRKFAEGVPHPRGYGNNARVLGRYVRELKLLTLEEAVRKMTKLPAETFRLGERGELRAGFAGDVVIFDPQTVGDPANFAEPHAYAAGFSEVVVNGVPVIREGKLTAARPGRPVKLVGK
jgi:N-acyl-D-amino-acid deacylase